MHSPLLQNCSALGGSEAAAGDGLWGRFWSFELLQHAEGPQGAAGRPRQQQGRPENVLETGKDYCHEVSG